MAALHDLSALEQAAAVRHREVSPSELVEHYLDRIATWSDTVGAYVTVTADLARAQARQAEQTLREGGRRRPAAHYSASRLRSKI